MILRHTPFLLAGGLAFLALLVQKHKGYKSTKTDTPEAHVSEAVNHGITMRSSSTLQYLHYIEQIGLALSPMSNNALFLAYERCEISRLRKVCAYLSSNGLFLAYQRYMRISASFSPTKGMY